MFDPTLPEPKPPRKPVRLRSGEWHAAIAAILAYALPGCVPSPKPRPWAEIKRSRGS